MSNSTKSVVIDEKTFKHIKIGMIPALHLNGILHPRVPQKEPCKVSFDAGWDAAKEYFGLKHE